MVGKRNDMYTGFCTVLNNSAPRAAYAALDEGYGGVTCRI